MNNISDVVDRLMNRQTKYKLVDLSKFACDADCDACNGYIRIDLPSDHPQFGQIFVCPIVQRNLVLQNGGGGLTPGEVMNLDWNLVLDNISDAHKTRQAGKTVMDQGWGLLFLYGSYGQGKTLVLKIGVARALRQGKTAHYANMSSILDDIRQAYDEKDGQQTALLRKIEKWSSISVLAIDELDKVNATPWARQVMHQVLDQRYTLAIREQAVTLIAANLNIDKGLDDLDGYLASRLQDSRIGYLVELSGPDGRQVMPAGYQF